MTINKRQFLHALASLHADPPAGGGAGPNIANYHTATKESKRGMIAFKNSESNPQLTLTSLRCGSVSRPFLCYPSS